MSDSAVDENLDKKLESSTAGWKLKVDTLIVLLISLTPFNLSVVDKTGLDTGIDNTLDKVVRVAWFLFCILTVCLLKPRLFRRVFAHPSPLMKLLFCYMIILTLSLVVNGVGVTGFYRLCEYILLLFALDIVDKTIRLEGRDAAVRVFAGWVQMAAVAIVIMIAIGLVISPNHFYALETQGRFRLGGNAYSPNFIGMVFASGMLSSLYLMGRARTTLKKFLILMCCLFFGVALYFTGSRTAQFSVAIAICLWVLLNFNVMDRALLCAVCMIFVIPLLLLFYEFFVERLLPLIGKGERPLYDLLTLNNRSVVAEVGLQGALDHWYLGVGFVEGVKEYYRLNFTQSYWLPPHTHNALIESFLSGGVLSLLLMSVVFYKAVKLILRNLACRQNSPDIYLAALSLPLILGCVTMTIFGGVYTVLTFWFFSLALFSWSKNERKDSVYS
ncbi:MULTISPECIES: O-antigen ligase [Pseudomonas]|uniref:O-antigen ligase family protein n=1 Tax=Pseudomonas TaxID=286 RepID=UPI000F4D0B0B|nr:MULTISPECIES: O-antigen ligase family protein [Pseudomonas]MBG8560830.1 O-antigen ligase family protein [Pseudomonas qingdaonensis]